MKTADQQVEELTTRVAKLEEIVGDLYSAFAWLGMALEQEDFSEAAAAVQSIVDGSRPTDDELEDLS